MTDQSTGLGEGKMTIEDLPQPLRQQLLAGWARGWGSHGGGRVSDDLTDEARAYSDGERLANAVTRLVSSDLVDYGADSRRYSALVEELNARYGAGLVVHDDEIGPGGERPGFRRRAQSDTAGGDA